MNQIPKWVDHYTDEKNRTILTEAQLQIPGLRMLGHHVSTNATESLSWHIHENAFEFSLPSKGAFSFSTAEGSFSFSGGQVFLSRPNEVHGTNEVPITVGELYWFQLDTSSKDRLLFLNPQAASALIRELHSISRHVVKTDAKKTLPLLRQAFEMAAHGQNRYLVASLLQLFLHLVILFSRKETGSPSPDIQKSLARIQTHLTQDLPLEELASAAGLSCSQFKQKFKKQMGVAPRSYINQQKIEYAKMLLKEGRSVTETAMALSFTTSNYFSTVFKKYTTYAPREYQRQSYFSGHLASPAPSSDSPTVSRASPISRTISQTERKFTV